MSMRLDELVERIRRLPPVKRKKVEDLLADLEAEPMTEQPPKPPRTPLAGRLRHLGLVPFAEELMIDET